MTTAQKIKHVEKAVRLYGDLNAAWAPLTAAVRTHDFPAWEQSWRTFDAYVAATSELIGDAHKFLSWFIIENDCGARGLTASIDGATFRAETPEQLVAIVEAMEGYE